MASSNTKGYVLGRTLYNIYISFAAISRSYYNYKKLCRRPPQYAPAPTSWPFDL